MNIAFEQKIVASPEALVSVIAGESVILNTKTEQYYELDEVGTGMWTKLTASDSIQAAYEALLNEYEVDEESLRKDLVNLIEKLQTQGLIKIDESKLAKIQAIILGRKIFIFAGVGFIAAECFGGTNVWLQALAICVSQTRKAQAKIRWKPDRTATCQSSERRPSYQRSGNLWSLSYQLSATINHVMVVITAPRHRRRNTYRCAQRRKITSGACLG